MKYKEPPIYILVIAIVALLAVVSVFAYLVDRNMGEVSVEEVSEVEAENIDEEVSKENFDNIDTSDWLTYENEEVGFSFLYPESYKIQEVGFNAYVLSKDGITIELKVNDYSEIPRHENGSEISQYSQTQLDTRKKHSSGLMYHENAQDVIIKVWVSYLDDMFYKRASFFVGNDFIEIDMPLDEGRGEHSDYRGGMGSATDKIQRNDVSLMDYERIKTFESIIDSIKTVNL